MVKAFLWVVMFLAVGVAWGQGTAPATRPAAFGELKPGEVVAITWPELQKQLEAKKDEVVLVDFWATWCIPCVKALPDLAEIGKKYEGKHVRVVLVSFDDPDDAGKVGDRLKVLSVPFGTYLMKPEDRDRTVDGMSAEWKDVALPASFVYSAAGKQVYHHLLKTHTVAEWAAVLDPLVK